jgi:hypothetical protein
MPASEACAIRQGKIWVIRDTASFQSSFALVRLKILGLISGPRVWIDRPHRVETA